MKYTLLNSFTVLKLWLFVNLLGVVFLECPLGWHHYDNSCYLFSTDRYNWLDAESSCRAHDARLAEVVSKNQSDYLMNMAITVGKDESYWLGGRDDVIEGTWIWASTDKVFTYTDWYPGQPNNYNNNEDCLHMYASFNMKWNDFSCAGLNGFVCEKRYPRTTNEPEIIG
ncbi:perlucin-like [Mytilus californianus]|uniref:perlucin-like n=1 Tax=Mytilus californianus TaxID=6549 RepID=UPI0022478AAC|nr:perlucin-like [Mytilus californianus]